MIKILFEPGFSDENEYINNFISGLENNHCNVINKDKRGKFQKLKCMTRALFQKEVKIIHFNWIENYAKDRKLKNCIKLNVYLLFIKIAKLKDKKIVWTMHNTIPHGTLDDKYINKFYKQWLSLVDLCIIHSKESGKILEETYNYSQKKICYIPHGKYHTNIVDSLEKKKAIKRYGINDSDRVFLYFGQIDDYKNIPLLISAYKDIKKENTKLLICGKFSSNVSDDIKNEILKEKDNTIILDIRFIPNEEVSSLFQISDFVVLPYEKKSMQNSGVAILAISEGIPIIIPRFGYINDINSEPFIFSYNYFSKMEHYIELKKELELALKIPKNLIMGLRKKEKEFANKELDWITITQKVCEEYRKLVDKNEYNDKKA